jgi:4a-hydroxytetrahydrobiopterin dehydratase
MTDQISPIAATAFHDAAGADGWRVLGDGAYAHYRTASYAESAAFVQALGKLPSVVSHPPAVDIRAGGVTFRLLTTGDEYYGMSEADLDVATAISAAARERDLEADPSAVQNLLIVPGAPANADIAPFWRAVLGYEPRADSPDEDLVDPQDRDPAFWFEGMDEPRGDGGGAIHIGVWVPIDRAEERVAAALAAGGRIVRDHAPSWWTLADPAGNEADIATVAATEDRPRAGHRR